MERRCSFVPGKIFGESRNKKAVSELHALAFDLDRDRTGRRSGRPWLG